MSEKDETSYFGRACAVVSLVLATLKLAGVIDLPWWIVALPILLPFAILLLLLFILVVVVGTFNRRGR